MQKAFELKTFEWVDVLSLVYSRDRESGCCEDFGVVFGLGLDLNGDYVLHERLFDFIQIFLNLNFEEMGETFWTRVFQNLVKRQFRI